MVRGVWRCPRKNCNMNVSLYVSEVFKLAGFGLTWDDLFGKPLPQPSKKELEEAEQWLVENHSAENEANRVYWEEWLLA